MSSIKGDSARLVINHLSRKIRALEKQVRLLKYWHKRESRFLLNILKVGREYSSSEIHEDNKRTENSYLAFFLIITFCTLSACIAFAYFHAGHTDKKVGYEFASYAMPALAALVAGLTVIKKSSEIVWFWISTFFVWAGVALFVISEGFTAQLLWKLIFVYGMTATAYVAPYIYFKTAKDKKKISINQWIIITSSLLILATSISIYLIHSDVNSPPSWFSNMINSNGKFGEKTNASLECRIKSEDKNNNSVTLVCASK